MEEKLDTTIEQPSQKNRGIFAKLRGYFIAGVLVTAPLAITIYLACAIIAAIDTKVSQLLPAKYHPETYLPFNLPGTGIIIVTIIFIMIGAFAAGYIGKFFVRFSERLLDRVPVVRSVYGAVKQIAQSILAQESQAFKEVVLLEYPMKGKWALGFISGRTKGEIQEKTKGDVVSVFVPTTPNPTSGFLLFVQEKDLTFLDMSVEDGIKMAVSSGIVVPEYRKKKLKKKK